MSILLFSFIMFYIIINVRKKSESSFSALLRILANYLHIITLSLLMSSNYPSFLTEVLGPVRRLGGSVEAFLSFDCLIKDHQFKSFFGSIEIFKFFLLGMLPLILFGIVSLIWTIVYIFNKKWVKNFKRNLIISFISIVFLMHPKLTESSINAFR